MYIVVNGVTLHVEIHGEGEPLLLLHGFTGSLRNWSPFIPRWSEQYQVITVDLLGHGLSDSPEDPQRYAIEQAVDDLITLMNTLNIRKTHVLGYSMGGRLALSLAVLEPSRVSKLILESSSPGLRIPHERRERVRSDQDLADRIECDGIERFVTYWGDLPLFQAIKNMPADVSHAMRQQRLQNNPLGLANSLRGMGTGAQPSWWDHLAELAMPVLFVAGEQDEKFAQIAQEMQQSVPQSLYKSIPNAGHLAHVEQPRAFDTIVVKFLGSKNGEGLV